MGMFNEVFAPCPECGSSGYTQIAQLVSGFGGFYLTNFSTLEKLDSDDVESLYQMVEGESFECQNEDCRHYFKFVPEGYASRFSSAVLRQRAESIEKDILSHPSYEVYQFSHSDESR